MTILVEPVNETFVARVTRVNLAQPLTDDEFAKIHDAFDRYAVLIFPDQPLIDEQQLAFSERFGPLEAAPNYAGTKLRLPPVITDISNLDHAGKLLAPEDRLARYNLGNQMWHTDSSFKAVRAKCSLLSAREVTESGGETQYADMRAAYDALSDDEKQQVAGLVAEHSIATSRRKSGFDSFNGEITTTLPPVPQRLVDHYTASGRTSLFLASHASHILGMPVEEGEALLAKLMEHATQDQFVYTHNWTAGDLVIWDNRCTMHRGRPYDPAERRVLHRTTISDVKTAFQNEPASPVAVARDDAMHLGRNTDE